jgi:hypothetical protein
MTTEFEVIYPEGHPQGKTKAFGHRESGGALLIGSTGGSKDGFLARITLAPDVHLQLFPKYGLVAMEVCDNSNTNLPAGSGDLFDHLFSNNVYWEGEERLLPEGKVAAADVKPATALDATLVRAAIKKLQEVATEKASSWGLNHRLR